MKSSSGADWNMARSTSVTGKVDVPAATAVYAVLDAAGGVLAYGRIERLQALLSQTASELPPAPGEGLPAVAALEVPVLGALGARAKTTESFIGSLEAGGREWIATVVPLKTTACPAVSIARCTAAAFSSPAARSSRQRVSTSSE